uniref:Uncharacterized protein n=1 Tax=Anguilla anguilla TaxID=7936 RepID=A0A0E9Y0A6_ANGAN
MPIQIICESWRLFMVIVFREQKQHIKWLLDNVKIIVSMISRM